ncbi:actin depolymerizing protein [Dacryopinax primogenitus]|uniref:Actin depolymerizing protein n=1 Tax=Dacryopinax primogenitus (strain DJM 731) TaxID=1858805 RepID=M5G905_DACPD|nr:actin depolymerizing protein [Dacryopinax primogenitus]EJU05194.1 actin depolymerizing protein [Dacryopinax primogenitus]
MSGITSGITVSEELSTQFKQSAGTRVIKVSIDNELLVVSKTLPLTSSLSSDVQHISSIVDADTAAYLLVQLDSKGKWVLVSYVPDTCTVRQKMLYASTRNALTRGLGAAAFVDSAFISAPSDLASTLVSRSTSSTGGGPARSATSPGLIPLSNGEKELASIRAAEAVELARSTTPRSLHQRSDMQFEEDADAAISELNDGEGQVVVLGIKTGKEKDVFVLKNKEDVPHGQGLASVLPKGEPSYVLYALSVNGNRVILFVYFCPNDASVKEKMVYSTSFWNVVKKAEEHSLNLARRIEVSELSELTYDHLISELKREGAAPTGAGTVAGAPADRASSSVSAQRGFARPTRPGRKVFP